MPAITVRRIPLADTKSYVAPNGLSRVRMTPNGVQMLAAVNGRGSYDEYHGNGAKKHRKKARRRSREAASLRRRAGRRGLSRGRRADLYSRARRKSKKARKQGKKAKFHKAIKKMAHSGGMKRKELLALLRDKGLSKAEAKAEVMGSAKVPSGFPYKSSGSSLNVSPSGFGGISLGGSGGGSVSMKPNRRRDTVSGGGMAGIRKYYKSISRHASKAEAKRALVKKFGSKLAAEALRTSSKGGSMASKRKKGRGKSRRRTGYRSAARRKSRKSSRKVARRSSRRSSRGRRKGYRRNGEGEFAMNTGDLFTANSHDDDDDDDGDGEFMLNGSEMTANKSRYKRKRKAAKKSRKRAKAQRKFKSKKGVFGKKMLKEMGIFDHVGNSDPLASMLIDKLADNVESGKITFEQYKEMRKKIAKAAFPQQKGYGKHRVPVDVTDPFSGKTKTLYVPWKGKVRTAFGPFKRRAKRGVLTYEYEKGQKIPEWAETGAYSVKDQALMFARDLDWRKEAMEIQDRIYALRAANTSRMSDKVQRQIEKLEKQLNKAITKGGGMYTPNRRGKSRRKAARKGKRRSSSRRGSRRLRDARGRFRSGKGRKSRSSKRRSRKGRSYKRNGRRGGKRRSSRGRRMGRKFGRRRGRKSGKRRSSRRMGRGRRRGRKAGRRRFRRNSGLGAIQAALPGALAGTVGFVIQHIVTKLAGDQVNSSLTFAKSYAPLLTSAVVSAIGSFAAGFIGEYGKDVAKGMILSFLVDALKTVAPSIPGLSGIPYLNTSGWGSRRPLSAYELRGLGQYELRGLGATPVQALAEYELRGLGATPVQALAGGYAQALAGNPNYAQAMAAYELRGLGAEGILPSQADAALDMADQDNTADVLTSQGGEYVNTQLRPSEAMFWGDPLNDLGVPGRPNTSIPWKSIWNPDTSGVDPTGGIFDDPNTLPPGRAGHDVLRPARPGSPFLAFSFPP